jgi:hypothetical protein
MRMAEEFTGVPADRWRDISESYNALRLLACTSIILVCLLLAALIRKGVLSGIRDLWPSETGTAMGG